jgi:[protein-PII] uridylyltransferase
VVDVFATDTQGLLYTLAQTLFSFGLTVHLARIATNIDQVVDVFYVVDEHQRKVENPGSAAETESRRCWKRSEF